MKCLILALVFAAAACGAPPHTAPQTPPPAQAAVEHSAPPGEYRLEKSHASLIVRLGHMGYSQYTARFEIWDATLNLDVEAPENSSINVTIDPRSIASDNPPAGFIDIMRGADFLDAAQFPEISFRSTQIERTGANTARIVGDLTLHGVTRPVTLEARFNGGYAGMALDPNGRVGFSAHGVFNRSWFAMAYAIPPAGSNMGVSDAVEVIIETEFTGPAWTPQAAPTP
jgi:polyisoprenoid-binding protein YceI